MIQNATFGRFSDIFNELVTEPATCRIKYDTLFFELLYWAKSIDKLIVDCLTSSYRYFKYIQDNIVHYMLVKYKTLILT